MKIFGKRLTFDKLFIRHIFLIYFAPSTHIITCENKVDNSRNMVVKIILNSLIESGKKQRKLIIDLSATFNLFSLYILICHTQQLESENNFYVIKDNHWKSDGGIANFQAFFVTSPIRDLYGPVRYFSLLPITL